MHRPGGGGIRIAYVASTAHETLHEHKEPRT